MQPLPRLSPRLTLRDEGEDGEVKVAKVGGFVQSTPRSSNARRPAILKGSFVTSIRKLLPGVLVAALVLILLLLFGSHTINTSIERPLGTVLFTYQGHSDFVDAVAWSPNGQLLASASGDGTVQIWRASNGSHARKSCNCRRPFVRANSRP